MPEDIEIIEDLGIIQITSVGLVTEEDLRKSRQSVFKICQERKLNKILIDASRITSLPTITQLFQHGVSLSEPEVPRHVKFAVVVSEATRKESRFIEDVAMNRNANLRNFETRDQALAWLKG